MRIFYLANSSSIHTQRLVRYFTLKGHEVHLISSIRHNNIESIVSQFHLLKMFPFKIKYISSLINYISYTIQIRRLITQYNPDLLHSIYVSDWGLIGMFTNFHPFILTALGSDVLIDMKKFSIINPLIKRALHKADLITSNGYNVIEDIVKYISNPEKCELVLFGVELRNFTPERKDEDIISKLKIDQSPVIISTRNLNRVYDVETLIKAIPLIKYNIPNAKFIIIGKGDQKEYLMNIARSLNVIDDIRFLGHIPHEELGKYLAISDVYVSTSLSDTFAVSTLEAMACQLPVVVTDVGDIRRWVKNNENGYIIPFKRPDLLAQKIIYLIQHIDLRKNMGENNRKSIVLKAIFNNEMNKLNLLYNNIVVNTQC